MLNADTDKVQAASVENVKTREQPLVRLADLSPLGRRARVGGMPGLAFGWELNLLLPESPVCSNGGLRKRMAGPITDGTILYIPSRPRAYFPAWLPFVVRHYWSILCTRSSPNRNVSRCKSQNEAILQRSNQMGRCWGAQKEMRCSTASLPRVYKVSVVWI